MIQTFLLQINVCIELDFIVVKMYDVEYYCTNKTNCFAYWCVDV